MTGKVLITYATRAGSTAEVAQAIAEVLRARSEGENVDVAPVKEVQDLSPYRAVIVGSAIRMGSWLPEAVEFVTKNQAALDKVPTAFFLVSGYLKDDTPEMRAKVSAFLDPVRAMVKPGKEGLFAGKMDYSKITFLDRLIAKMVKSVEGDWRNWDQIRAWAADAVPAA
jgi:menaquinone-dependent protoporphyrinogen oxidase